MTLNTLDGRGRTPKTYLLVRIGTPVAMGAAPAPYLLEIGAAEGALVAVAPVGVVLAARGIAERFGLPPQGETEG